MSLGKSFHCLMLQTIKQSSLALFFVLMSLSLSDTKPRAQRPHSKRALIPAYILEPRSKPVLSYYKKVWNNICCTSKPVGLYWRYKCSNAE